MITPFLTSADAGRQDSGAATMLSEQQRRWKNGDRISVEELCREFQTVDLNDDQRLDLIYQEVMLREECGEHPVVEEYLARFPDLTAELRLQFELDEAIQETPADLLQILRHATDSLDREQDVSPAANPPNFSAPGLPVIEGYQILERVGQGGMAIVFKARHLNLNRLVAIKMLRDHYGATASHVRRFLTEAHVAASLQHPHIVQIYDVGQYDGRPFLAYEFLDQGTLSAHFRGQAQEPRFAAALCEILAKTLHYAHQQGVVHRDFKPANILLHRVADEMTLFPDDSARRHTHDREKILGKLNGLQIKVADFGLAKILETKGDSDPDTGTGDILGTPAYMSPEQARGDASQVSAATDIYALGATLYELLTGRPPFVGARPMDVLGQVLAGDPIRPSQLVPRMPTDLQTICLKCLEKSPARRYASAADVAADLARFLAGEPILARRVSTVGRGWRWCRHNPIKSVVGASLVLLLVLISAVSSAYSVLLGKQLDLTSIAQRDERAAKISALERLWDARLSRAEALWASRRTGQRYAALEAIQDAQQLGNSLRFSSNQVDRMRNATIACLSRPDLRIMSHWPLNLRDQPAVGFTTDIGMSVFAFRTAKNEIVVSRVADGFELLRLTDCTPNSLPQLSSDGHRFAVVDEQCRIFQLSSSAPLQSFESSGPRAWSFSPDHRQMIGTDKDGKLLIVNLQDLGDVKSFEIHTKAREIAISPDSSKAAILAADSLQVIELSSGNVLFRTDPPEGDEGGCRLAWHPNSSRLASGSYYGEGVALWDVNDGTKCRTFPHSSGQLTICFGSMGDLLLTYDHWSRKLILWDANNGDVEFSENSIGLSAIMPDAAGGFRALQLLEASKIAAVSIDHPQICRSLALTQESQFSVSTTDLAYNSDGRLLVVAASGHVHLFETTELEPLGQQTVGSAYVRFDADDSLLIFNQLGLNRWTATLDRTPDRLASGNSIPTLTLHSGESLNDSYSNACFDVDHSQRIIAVSEGNNAIVWHADVPNSKKIIGPHLDIRSVSINARGKQLATGGWHGGKACIWDLDSGALVHQLDEPDCCLVQFSPDGKWLVTNAADLTVRRTDTWQVETTLDVSGQSASGVKACFSDDGQLLAVADSSARIHLFETSHWREVATLAIPCERNVFHLAFSPTGTQLTVLLAPFDNRVMVWHLDSIGSELRKRGLPWSIAQADGPSQSVNSDRIGRVLFSVDARFAELAATEQVQRALRAAEKYDLSTAHAAIRQAIKLQPKQAETCNNLAWLLATGPAPLRNPAFAVELGRRAVNDPSLTAMQQSLYFNTLGISLYRDGQIDEAIEVLNRSLSCSQPEQQPFDLYFLSMCYAHRGDHATARRMFRRAETLVVEHKERISARWRAEMSQFAEESQFRLGPPSSE